MLSIIIPIYHVERYLRQCLESVKNQTFADWEAVCVDDGSDDKSGAIAEDFAARDPRFRVIHVENGGVSRARNIGIEASRGEIISFVDADDWLDPRFYERLMPEMERADLVFVSDCHHYADGTLVTHAAAAQHAEGREDVERVLLYLKRNAAGYPFFGFTWNKLFRADIIRDHHLRFIEGLTLCEDEAFTDDYCRYVDRVTVVPDTLYQYRAGMSGLTGRQKNEQEYFLLIDHVFNMSKYYTLSQLVDYEHQRVYDLTADCCISGGYLSRFFQRTRTAEAV